MTESHDTAAGIPLGSAADRQQVKMYTDDFAADPHRAYAEMRRRFGDLVPVLLAPDVPATLVVGYRTALRILNDAERFPADPRRWQQTIHDDEPIRAMMEWYPAARNNEGQPHRLYRGASVAAIDGIDLVWLEGTVADLAEARAKVLSPQGPVDLVTQYAAPLVLDVLDRIVGCPAEIGARVATGMAARFDTVDAARGMKTIKDALLELIRLKRREPGNDATSRLVHHQPELEDIEVFAQLMSFYGAGFEAQRNLITNALLLILTDNRFAGAVLGGAMSTRDAIDKVLFTDPPMANFCTTFPRQPILIDEQWLPANQPVVISLTACNTDPAINGGSDLAGNRSHLAWSIGRHGCPAKDPAYVVVRRAIDYLLDAFPDMELAAPVNDLTWRPGPFHRALTALPVSLCPN